MLKWIIEGQGGNVIFPFLSLQIPVHAFQRAA